MKTIPILLIVSLLFGCTSSANNEENNQEDPTTNDVPKGPVMGAEQMDVYLPLLEGKRVAMLVNHTTMLGETHLVDTLKSRGVNIVKVFAAEHGFRGDADAGQKIEDGVDSRTGIPIVSLYGKTRKPTAEMLADIDMIIYDIQDVGVRFYTFISTMHHTMEAAAESGKQYMVLDRPNPNGMYVDGPIREDSLKSFVGINPVPVVHGLTVGEMAQMAVGEKWLGDGLDLDLNVIAMKNYTHNDEYSVPIKPSPNLPNDQAIKLYASTCLFEGTTLSEGRGTYEPFQKIGHPDLKGVYEFSFTPVGIKGMASKPKHKDVECFGIDLSGKEVKREYTLSYLLDFYNKFPDKGSFWKKYINLLEGTGALRSQIEQGMTEEEIRQTWEPGLSDFKKARKKYLLYPDFN